MFVNRIFHTGALALVALLAHHAVSAADSLPLVLTNVEHQPLAAQVERVATTLEMLGTPLAKDQRERLNVAIK
jgi:hypothetical protein